MSCKTWGSLEKYSVAPAVDSGGGGGGARAAARFSAGRAGGDDPPFATAGPSAAVARRGQWVVQDVESPQRLSDVSKRSFRQRWRLKLPGESGQELGRVLGGGVVPGSLILVGGEPGVGKSTLLLQVADMLTRTSDQSGNDSSPEGSTPSALDTAATGDAAATSPNHLPDEQQVVLYVSGEESAEQIGSRAERMSVGGNPNVYLYSATRLELILDAVLRLRPKALVVDSIQTVYLDDLPSSAGSVVQVRECASALLQVAKRERIPVFLVGHVTKSGDIAGPRVLEHIVDVVVYMEGGRQQAMRMVRCVKNRYGATDEVGVFSMEDSGLNAVLNPSAFFLSSRDTTSAVSSAVTVVMEGSRPLLMEVQALCSTTPPGSGAPPLRSPTGVRKERLWLILAVLGKHTAMRPYSVDVHLNVTGGLAVSEPAADLSIAVAIASSYYERPIAPDVAMVGEVGLGGELRPVMQVQRRIAEAAKLGFTRVIIPAGSDVGGKGKARQGGVTLVECRTVGEAIEAALGPGTGRKSARRSGPGPQQRREPDEVEEEAY